MFRFLNNTLRRGNQSRNKNKINELMNEVGKELGVDPNTRSLNEDPNKFAERMKKEIQKRT
ncbi:hypothetical protein ACFO25_06565 [Paenactinomyces guangxiensis]|uniref:Uncharacterized protein n=1 Tax=Paenactinomyces guangxiensis TaxID=1490290 RepID=A0A7W1WNY0_9BACL|nr:hypothetical protein [Paenactinomyces guangxiensis]MBA4493286.1 hypothetical protein [Paenactinomyces guangxiensis]MBH8589863.1 hypothetical protein [Paenactinomyces guangxiensis]